MSVTFLCRRQINWVELSLLFFSIPHNCLAVMLSSNEGTFTSETWLHSLVSSSFTQSNALDEFRNVSYIIIFVCYELFFWSFMPNAAQILSISNWLPINWNTNGSSLQHKPCTQHTTEQSLLCTPGNETQHNKAVERTRKLLEI